MFAFRGDMFIQCRKLFDGLPRTFSRELELTAYTPPQLLLLQHRGAVTTDVPRVPRRIRARQPTSRGRIDAPRPHLQAASRSTIDQREAIHSGVSLSASEGRSSSRRSCRSCRDKTRSRSPTARRHRRHEPGAAVALTGTTPVARRIAKNAPPEPAATAASARKTMMADDTCRAVAGSCIRGPVDAVRQ